MPATHIGVVIGAASRLIRRKIVVDDDSEFAGIQARLAPGEHLVQIPLLSLPSNPSGSGSDLRNATLHPIIATQTGIAAPTISPRLVQIDLIANQVVAAFLGDINIDKPTVATHLLVQNDVAGIGWTYAPATKVLTGPIPPRTALNPNPVAPTTTLVGAVINSGSISVSV